MKLKEILEIIGNGPGIGHEKELLNKIYILKDAIEKYKKIVEGYDSGYSEADTELFKSLEDL